MKTKKHQNKMKLIPVIYICMAIGSIVYAANLTQAQKDACANAANEGVTSPGGGYVNHSQEDCCENFCMFANGGDGSAPSVLNCEADCEKTPEK